MKNIKLGEILVLKIMLKKVISDFYVNIFASLPIPWETVSPQLCFLAKQTSIYRAPSCLFMNDVSAFVPLRVNQGIKNTLAHSETTLDLCPQKRNAYQCKTNSREQFTWLHKKKKTCWKLQTLGVIFLSCCISVLHLQHSTYGRPEIA